MELFFAIFIRPNFSQEKHAVAALRPKQMGLPRDFSSVALTLG
jgi:hypothetical protein